ncbi:hypothetical protein ACFODO_22880 [Acinetobacter sichuanensis]|uniref:Uncharacterized protein n=1 Tax=Acinetobacter sichuanensis TaxID=2136183 RepID=A0A371YL24_9GAMM|nr:MULTISPECIES: hypothetical protein [Acinetobacter]MDM1247508.1 hypothetical protein [Acinetobacter sp. R933-2]MDM1763273.1 hypothetical protein [Acinetobacter sp. 226-1]MDM1766752.1 hypothetical protein [Acinetobacter sp. 226-4]MDQ9020292.1 hypothetical protein [Acinetobacter sichuanensis]RFC82177.1 hypothetical protein C9E89_018020 [Acinetobacter sichuanensis]
MTFQLIDVNNSGQNVTCPHCQHAVLDWSQEQYIQPCEHTLFIAMDLGFEFISDAFEQTMPRSVDEIHAHDEQGLHILNELTQATFKDYQIYKMDLGVEGLYRYIGFSQVAL